MRRLTVFLGTVAFLHAAQFIAGADPPPVPVPPVDPGCAATVPAAPGDVPGADDTPDSLERAHQFATGAGVRVAVIDTGVAPHPRLPRVIPGGDLVVLREHRPDAPPPPDGALDDCDAHGTIVAGILAARPSPDDGIVGVAPGVDLVSIRQTSTRRATETVGAGGSLASLTDAVNLALDQGARVINVSLTSCLSPEAVGKVDTDAFDDALARAEELGVVVVAAAGNAGDRCPPGSVVLPAHRPTVISVSAIDTPHTVADYSVAGPGPLLSAPGRVPVALSPRGPGFVVGVAERSGTGVFEGTSFAAPVVSGTAALLIELHPTDSAAGIRARIAAAVDPATGTVDPATVITHVPADYRGIPHPVSVATPIEPPTGIRERSLSTVTILLVVVGVALIVRYAGARRRRVRGRVDQ
ncbi:S8 family serine peptidase [Corynebacterium sp. P7202]|uniref:S8 family serine peptidase n=1 Tax=Corynebacterium pygosceleis TaxID=2800406 RepID=A0A9Q4C6Z6_9CORY|nr:S8 family serine peptidase [Corynebacterium pygosceleis]MCK7637555.1 S8 family serine peptidase [Corynebacterium pygosceleis]MCX7468116.1 S8 family serine peptidase [Corynebacterium pygosceleis]